MSYPTLKLSPAPQFPDQVSLLAGMVIASINSGLGNQLFQYAMARRLAYVNDLPLKLDLTWYERSSAREYLLHHFKINAEIATQDEIASFRRLYGRPWAEYLSQLMYKYLPHNKGPLIKEQSLEFDPGLLEVKGRAMLVGYWQCERYFIDIQDIIRRELTFKHEPDEINKNIAAGIASVESVSVHIRRGDYLADPRFHICSLDYYHAALKEVAKTVRHPHFFIFSDDQLWSQANLKLEYPATFITHNGESRSHEDLRLMSSCKHFITANSTFSWWGAWLGAHPEKIVITPKKWVNDPKIDSKNRIPQSWITI